jgi:hypothetical protein
MRRDDHQKDLFEQLTIKDFGKKDSRRGQQPFSAINK